MFRSLVLVCGMGVVVLGGCQPSTQERDCQFALHKAEAERDALRDKVQSERSRYVALYQTASRKAEEYRTVQAELSTLQERHARLARAYSELEGVVDELKNKPIERPVVPASPLPDQVDEALQSYAGKYGDRVTYDRGRGAISFANDRLFELGSDEVRADAREALQELASVLAMPSLDDYEVIIVGHTDAAPIKSEATLAKHPTNWHLSVHRAIGVRDVLEQAGVPPARMAVMGYGKYRPIGDEPARNRRVEIFIARRGSAQALQPVRPGGGR